MAFRNLRDDLGEEEGDVLVVDGVVLVVPVPRVLPAGEDVRIDEHADGDGDVAAVNEVVQDERAAYLRDAGWAGSYCAGPWMRNFRRCLGQSGWWFGSGRQGIPVALRGRSSSLAVEDFRPGAAYRGFSGRVGRAACRTVGKEVRGRHLCGLGPGRFLRLGVRRGGPSGDDDDFATDSARFTEAVDVREGGERV